MPARGDNSRDRRRRETPALLCILALLLMLPACDSPAAPAPEAALEDWLKDGPLEVHVAVDRLRISTPEDLAVTIDTRLAPGHFLDEPPLQRDARLGDWEIARVIRTSPALEDDGRTFVRRRVLLRPFLPGEYQLPTLDFAWRDFDGAAAGSLQTRPAPIVVESVLSARAPLRAGEYRDVVDPPRAQGNALAVALVATGAVLFVGGLLWAIARARARPEAPASPFAACRHRLARLHRMPLESSRARREAWAEVNGLLMLCLSVELEPGAAALSERQLARRVLAWPGLEPHDQAMLIGLFNRFNGLYDGRDVDEAETRQLLEAAHEGVRIIEKATAAARSDPQQEAAA